MIVFVDQLIMTRTKKILHRKSIKRSIKDLAFLNDNSAPSIEGDLKYARSMITRIMHSRYLRDGCTIKFAYISY